MATIGSGGTYSTIQAWEDDAPATLSAIWLGELLNQEFSAGCIMAGSTSTSSFYKHLTTASGASFVDNANKLTNALRYNASNGAGILSSADYIDGLIHCNEDYARISKLQIKTTATSSFACRMRNTANHAEQCIFEANWTAPGGAVHFDADGANVTNCLFIQNAASASSIVRAFGSTILANCTAVVPSGTAAATTGIDRAYPSSATYPNNAVFGATNAAVTTSTTYSNCYCDDSTPPSGFTQVAYDTSTGSGFENISAGTMDLRIKSTSALKGAGTATGAPSTDIVGQTRSTPPGVGAWESAASAPVITVQPTEQTAAAGGTATFTTTVTGATSYQWETKASTGGAWGNVSGGSGATSDDYTTGTLSRNDGGRLYRLKATNATGNTYSNEVLLRVTDIPTSYASSTGLVVGSSLSFVGWSFVGATDAAGAHATTGALAAQTSVVAGTAGHLTLHATSGALASDAATAAGTATHLTLHSTSGALSAAASTIAGTAAHHHATAGEINAAAATMAGTAAHLTLHTTSGAISAQASTIAGTAAHEHASSGALSAQDATISGAAAQSHDATGALVADAATLAGTAVHLTLHASSGALAAQDAAIAGSAAHQHATAGALAAADAAIAGTATRETPAGTHDASGALASDAATLAGTTAHLTLHVASGALAAQAAAVAGSAAHEHAASGVLAAGAATIAGTAAHFVLHATSGALAADSAAFAGAAAHEHAGTGALAAGTAAVAGTAAHTAPGVHATSGALQADAASVSGEAQILALFSRVHGFEMGGEAAKPKRRNLVTILADDKPKAEPSRKTITKRDVDRRVFERARDEARTVIETAAKAHAATAHPKAQRFAEVRTALKPLARALGDWNWIAVYQRMYEDAINAALREEMAREDARIVAEQEADERELMKLVMEWM